MWRRPSAFALVVSADRLVYFGDLTKVFAAVASTLRPAGHLVFTVEEDAGAGSGGYRLKPHGRYGHSEGYVCESLVAAGFAVQALDRVTPRFENQKPVEGLL